MMSKIILTAAAIFLSSYAMGQERNIVEMGCHVVNDTCYATFNGPAIAPSSACSGNQVRWHSSDVPGKNAYAAFMAAFMGNKKVTIVSSACFDGSTFPGMAYFIISK